MGLQLYQVDHRSYLLDFRNLNINSDHQHPLLNNQHSNLSRFIYLILSFFQGVLGVGTTTSGEDDMENVQPNRSLSWDFTDNENGVTNSEDGVSEVMEFFEMAASLIRTLAPDSGPKPTPAAPPTST